MGAEDELRDEDGRWGERRIRVDVFHHFPDGPVPIDLTGVVAVTADVDVTGALTVTVEGSTPPPPLHYHFKLVPGTPVRRTQGAASHA